MEVKKANDGQASQSLSKGEVFSYSYPIRKGIPNRVGCRMSFCMDYLNPIGNTIRL